LLLDTQFLFRRVFDYCFEGLKWLDVSCVLAVFTAKFTLAIVTVCHAKCEFVLTLATLAVQGSVFILDELVNVSA
jgi:hypothetical protein